MNLLVVVCLVIYGLIISADGQCAAGKDCYSNRYDNIDVDNILKSDRLLKRYVDCLMDRGACTREGIFLKEIIPDVMQHECIKCNEYQKQQAGKILSFLLQNKQEWWNELLGKYDKEGKFRKKFGIDDDDNDYDEDIVDEKEE